MQEHPGRSTCRCGAEVHMRVTDTGEMVLLNAYPSPVHIGYGYKLRFDGTVYLSRDNDLSYDVHHCLHTPWQKEP